jgi:penicillin-binding protein 1C
MRSRYLVLFIIFFSLRGVAHALPTYVEVRASYCTSDSILLDRHGDPLYELRTDQQQRRLNWTALNDISPALVSAVIQAEDKRFYDHAGVDYRSMGVALIKGKRTIWQKGRQILEAQEIEKGWPKKEILDAYLNLVAFRGELQGIAAASRGLFGKDPHGLDQSESLILASLIRSPNASSAEISKRALLLGQALSWSVGEEEINAQVNKIFLTPNFLRPRVDLAPHVARMLLKGMTRGRAVLSTLDSGIQRFALERLQHHLITVRSQNVKDGAVLVIENKTGEVLAYVSYSGDPAHGWFVDGQEAGGFDPEAPPLCPCL